MFGLPPTEPTYVCNWDFNLGLIFTEGGPTLYEGLGDAVSVFRHTFLDKENSLIVPDPPLYDVTMLRVKIPSLRALCHTEKSTLALLTSELTIQLNDLATGSYNSRLCVEIPDISFLCREKLRDKSQGSRVLGYFNTSLFITNFDRKKFGIERQRLQQEHIRAEDAAFNRASFLLIPELEMHTSDRIDPEAIDRLKIALPTPGLPPPLIVENRQSFIDRGSYGWQSTDIMSRENSSTASIRSVLFLEFSL